MNKEEYITFWLKSAERDWKVVNNLFKSKDYVYSLLFAHLVLEKLCKAHWVKDNKGNYPPKIHKLNNIIAQTKLNLLDSEMVFITDMNKFQIEGRYPDYVSNIHSLINADTTSKYIKQCNQFRKKLIALLPSK